MTLKTYHTLFLLFLVITIILFLLLLVIFFVFDIQKIISIKTGWAVKRNVEEHDQSFRRKENRQSRKNNKAFVLDNKNGKNSMEKQVLGMKQGENNSQQTALADKAGENSRTSATVKLGQEVKETIPLYPFTNEDEKLKEEPLVEKLRQKEPFDIEEIKTIMFSNEIIK